MQWFFQQYRHDDGFHKSRGMIDGQDNRFIPRNPVLIGKVDLLKKQVGSQTG